MASYWYVEHPLNFMVHFLVNVLLFHPFNSTVSNVCLSQFFMQTSKDNLIKEMFTAREIFLKGWLAIKMLKRSLKTQYVSGAKTRSDMQNVTSSTSYNSLGIFIKFSLTKCYSLESQNLISESKINLGSCYLNSGKLMPILSHRDSERLHNEKSGLFVCF